MKLVDAAEAARALGISLNTLYAYVSRGMLKSYEGPKRSRRYRWEDIERLRLRKSRPDEAARSALDWGAPVIESSLTHIDGSRLFYRGKDVADMARSWQLEAVACLLWWGDAARPVARLDLPAPEIHATFLSSAIHWLAKLQDSDPGGYDLRPEAVTARGWTIFCGLLQLLTGGAPPSDRLRAALILCADHELNASAFAARVAASTAASPYAVVTAALSTLSGPRHGGTTFQVEALFEEAERSGVIGALSARLRRGESVPGFGHRLYSDGDPRAQFLFESLPELQEWRTAGLQILGEEPSIDLALVGLTRSLGMPAGSAFSLFATGRCLGWIAHALEQYRDGRLLRPRARYVGVAP
jgi:citrate synthase